MKKNKKGRADIDFLKLFKHSLALSFSLFLFGAKDSYATTITGAGDAFNSGATQNYQGDWILTGGYIKGTTGFHHYSQFELSQGDIANLIFGGAANKFVNFVDAKIRIDGIFNAFKGNNPGNVVFVSPNGMIVGASGVMNVGSLQTITPNLNSYTSVVNQGRNITESSLYALKNDSPTSSTEINGKIFAQNGINIGEANKITIGKNADIVSGFNTNGFAKTKVKDFDMSNIVNSDGLVDSQYLTGSSGSIRLTANNISSESMIQKGSLIQSTGDVVIDTSNTSNSQIKLSSRIEAGNNATIGHFNEAESTSLTGQVVLGNQINAKNIKISGDVVTVNKGADLTATKTGGTVSTNTFRELHLNSNVTADKDINIKSAGTSTQGADSIIQNVNSGNITVEGGLVQESNAVIKNASTGNITIAGALNQNTGASIINEGTGNITLNTPNSVNLQKITAKHGSVDINTGAVVLNDTISSSANINIRTTNIKQSGDAFTGLEAGNDISFDILAGDIGTESQSINVSSGGNVSLNTGATGGANIKGTGDNDLTISRGNDLLYLNAASNNGINVTGDISSAGDVNLNANKGINQDTNTTIYSAAGSVNLENTTTGNIAAGNIITDGGSIKIDNTANGGTIDLNNSLSSSDSLIISSQGGINQADSADITHNGSGEFSVTNSVSGDMNLKNITNNDGNIILRNDAEGGNLAFNNLTGTHGFIDITSKGDVTQNGTITAGAANPVNNNSVTVNAGKNASLKNIESTNNVEVNADSVVLNSLVNAADGKITVTAAKDITQTITDTTLQASGSVNLTSNTGNIGSQGQRIIVKTDSDVIANASKAVNIEGKNTNIVLANITAGTDYNLGTTGTGDIILGGAFRNEHGSIKLDTDKALNITDDITAAGNISLISKNGIVQTDGTNIESGLGTATSGEIEITNFGEGGIDLTNVTAHKGGVRIENVETATGDINLGTINATGGDIYASNNALNGNVIIDSTLTTDSNIELKSDKNIIQAAANNQIALNAGNNIDLSSRNGTVGSVGKFILMNANNVVNAKGADIYLESPGKDLKTGLITATNTVKIKTTDNASDTNNNIILTNTISGSDIDIDSQGSILQETANTSDKTIASEGNLSLTAHTGNIGSTLGNAVHAVGFSSKGDLSANAVNGSVALNGIGTDIDTTNINAGKNIDLLTTGTGNIIVSNEQNVTGHINLDSAENIQLNKKIQATDNITLTAGLDITQDTNLTGTSLKSNKDINITAKNAGTAEKGIVVDALGEVNVGTADRHAGNIYLEDNTNDFVVGQMYADDNLSLKAQGSITQANSDEVAITSSGNVALHSETGSVGYYVPGSAIPFKVNVTGENASLNVTKAANVNIHSPNSDLSAGNINADGKVFLTNQGSGGIELKGLINANDVSLSAIDSIIQNKNVETKTIDARNSLNLVSSNGDIGATGEAGSAIKFSSNSLNASAQQGSVYLNGIETTINTNDIKALNDIDLTTTGTGDINVNETIIAQGHITLDAADELNLNGNLSAQDYIDIAANGGDILLNSVLTANTDITVKASGSIKQDAANNNPVLNAGKDINLTANSDIGSTDKSILLNADGVVNAKAGNTTVPVPGSIYIETPNHDLKTGTISATDTVKIAANGTGSDITLTDKISGKDIDIYAEGTIIQDLKSAEIQKSIEAERNLKLTANTGNIGQSGNSLDFSAKGNLEASAAQGSVYLNGIDTNINTSSIRAQNDIDLSTQNTGKITVSSDITTNNGYISLNSAESLELDKNLSAGKHITLNANGGILQSSGTSITSGTNAAAGEGNIDISNRDGGDVTLTNVTANKGKITVNNAALAEGSTAIAGDINLGSLSASDGLIEVLNAAQNGDIILNSLLNSGKNISISSSGNILQSDANTGLALNSGGDIILNSTEKLGDTAKHIKLNALGSVTADSNNVYLESLNKDLTIAGINSFKTESNGIIDLKTTGSGNIKINGQIKGGNVIIDSAQGINQSSSLTKAINAASDLTLVANNGSIGSKDAAQGGALRFSSGGDLSANASEAVVLDGIDTDITTSSVTAGTDIDLQTTIDKDSTKGNIIVNSELNAANGYISLNSAKGLNLNQNLTASKYINLAAKDGNITQASGTITANGQNTEGNGIDIVTSNGSIILNNAVSQNGGIKIAANETPIEGRTLGDINVGGLNANNGKISIQNHADGKNVVLTGLINANTNSIDITSGGNISQTIGDTTLSSTSNINLDASGNIGSATNSILADSDGTIQADGNDIYLGSKNKNLNIAGINSAKPDANGVVDLKTDIGNIHIAGLVKGGNINIDSAKSITQDASLIKSIDGQNINLTANNGFIGSDANAIDLSVKNGGKVDASASQDIYLNSPDADLVTGSITANNTVNINSNAALKLDGTISAQNAILKAANDITQNSNLSTSILAENVELTSTSGNIGEAASGSTEANAIDFSASGSLKASAQNGSLVLNGVNTSINTDSVEAGQNIDLSTTGAGSSITVSNDLTAGGYIRLNSADGLILNGDLTSIDYVSLAAQKDILLNHIISANTNIDINAAGQITQDSGNTVLNAGQDISLIAGTNIGSSTQSLLLNADGLVSANGQNIYLSSPNKQLNIAETISNGGGTVKLSTTGNGNVHLAGLVKGGNVTIDSAKSITQGSTLNKYIEAGNKLLLNAQDGDIGEAATALNPANAIDFSAGSVEAHAHGGSVVLNGVESSINTSSITADKNIDLSTTTSGSITVSSALNSANGYVNLNSAETLTLNENVSAHDYVSMGSKGDLLLNSIVTAGSDINIDTNGNIIQQNNDIALNAGNDINILNAQDVGSAQKSILVNAQHAVNVDSSSNVYLEDTTGDFTLGTVNADNYVKLTANGSILQSDYSKDGVVSGGNVDLISKNANIGASSANSVKVNVTGNVNAAAENGSIYLGSDNDINAGNIIARNSANIDSKANINLNGLSSLIKANEANLTAQNNITQTNEGKTIEVTGGNINLLSKSGNIGTPNGNAIGFSLQGAGVVNADANANGSVVLKGINSNINTSTIKAKNDIDLTTTGTGNIIVSNDLNAGGYISLDSANELELNNNLKANDNIELIARNGDIILDAILDSGRDIHLDATGNVTQMNTDTALKAANDISISAAGNIGSDLQSLTLNAGGVVSADGNNIYLTSPNADLTTGLITADGLARIDTKGAGSINMNSDISAQNGLSINAENGITQNADSTLSTRTGTLSVTANDGDLNLEGAVSSQNGEVSIVNESRTNASTTVNKLTAGNKFDIRHEGNGLLTVNGALNNNGSSTIAANNSGSESGLYVNGTINNNKGTLNIESKGQKGTTINGQINNDFVNDSTGAHSDIYVVNHNGALNVNSSKIDNGQTRGSHNTVSFINNGNGGLNIASNITNNGILTVENNAGAMNLSGALKAELGSKNTFVNGSTGDFIINSNIENKGNELTFEDKGVGSLVLGENAFITVYSVLDGDSIYTGTLNLKNSGTGNIKIDGKISGLEIAGTPQGSINIENNASGADSSVIFGSTAAIDAKNNSVNIVNNSNGGIQAQNGVDIKSDADINIQNTGVNGINFGGSNIIAAGNGLVINDTGSGNITFGDDTSLSADKDIEITKDNDGSINFGNNATLDSGLTTSIQNNSADTSITFKDNANLSGKAILIENKGKDGISFGDGAALTSDTYINLTNTGTDGGIVFNNNANIAARSVVNLLNSGNDGINLGTNSILNANSDILFDNSGAAGINIAQGTNLTSKDKLTLRNTGAGGITINGSAKSDSALIENENSNVYIAHDKANGTLIADKNVEINIQNGSLLNSSVGSGNNIGIKAGTDLDLNVNGGSIGVLDSNLNDIIQNGFVLDADNSIHISAGGIINAQTDNDLNLKSINSNMNINTLSAARTLLSSINGAITANSANTNNLYLYAKGNNANINIKNLSLTGTLTSESDLNTTIQSSTDLNAASVLSKNGSININSEGNTYINEIAAAEDITINVEDEKLTINNLGRVQRDQTVIPKTVSLTVKDAKRPHSGSDYRPGMSYDEIGNVTPNSKLDIYNAYVQDKVTLKADTITAQVYDLSDGAASGQIRVDANGNKATGFHNANKNGKLLEFDIQGANYAQEDVGSDPHNAFYKPDPNDKHALNVNLTLGDSINGAEFGADFKKLYSDYAFIDTVGSDPSAFSSLVFESGIIGEKAIFRNNKFRVDIDNTNISQNYPINKHYSDTPDMSVNNPKSFNLKMSDKIVIDVKPDTPVNPDYVLHNDPNKIVKIPTIDSLTKEPNPEGDDNSAVNSDKSTGFRNIGWVVRNSDNEVIGSSDEMKNPSIKSLVGISQKGILVSADTDNALQKNQTVHVEMKLQDVSFNIDGKITNINGNIAEIEFVNIDKLTQNVMLFLTMYSENL